MEKDERTEEQDQGLEPSLAEKAETHTNESDKGAQGQMAGGIGGPSGGGSGISGGGIGGGLGAGGGP